MYKEFIHIEEVLQNVTAVIMDYLEGYDIEDISIVSMEKNNGIIYWGLSISEGNSGPVPCLYPYPYLPNPIDVAHYPGLSLIDRFNIFVTEEVDTDKIARGIADDFIKYYIAKSDFDTSVFEFADHLDWLFVMLVNYDKNKLKLTGCPHRRFHDLALMVRYEVELDGIKGNIRVTDDILEMIGLSTDELIDLAIKNTEEKYPMMVQPIEDFYDYHVSCPHLPLKVVTNTGFEFGASAIMYNGTLEKLSDEMDGDYYILPSSIYEVIVVSAKDFSNVDMLKILVEEANRDVVNCEDVLSDSVYFYDSRSNEVSMVDSR